MALTSNKPRAARIVCLENSIFCTLNKEEYQKAVEINLQHEIDRKAQFLKKFKIFKGLSLKKLHKVVYHLSRIVTFFRGQTVFKQGQRNLDGLWLVFEGEFEVTQSIK